MTILKYSVVIRTLTRPIHRDTRADNLKDKLIGASMIGGLGVRCNGSGHVDLTRVELTRGLYLVFTERVSAAF